MDCAELPEIRNILRDLAGAELADCGELIMGSASQSEIHRGGLAALSIGEDVVKLQGMPGSASASGLIADVSAASAISGPDDALRFGARLASGARYRLQS